MLLHIITSFLLGLKCIRLSSRVRKKKEEKKTLQFSFSFSQQSSCFLITLTAFYRLSLQIPSARLSLPLHCDINLLPDHNLGIINGFLWLMTGALRQTCEVCAICCYSDLSAEALTPRWLTHLARCEDERQAANEWEKCRSCAALLVYWEW